MTNKKGQLSHNSSARANKKSKIVSYVGFKLDQNPEPLHESELVHGPFTREL